jgi:hypothetical protein
MIFGTWNIRSLYRVGSLMTVSREPFIYRLDLVGVQKSVAPNQQEYTHSSMERGMRRMNWVQDFYIRESYQQLSGLSL